MRSCAACGPDSFNFDVGTAVSGCELDIVSGGSACSEIYLHHESYGCVLAFNILWTYFCSPGWHSDGKRPPIYIRFLQIPLLKAMEVILTCVLYKVLTFIRVPYLGLCSMFQ